MRLGFQTAIMSLALMAVSASASLAMPAAQDAARSTAAGQSLIVDVHGCHRDVQEGRYGYHYHRGYNCDRFSVQPPRRHYRGPRCYTDCKYVGPIKVCKQRCD